MGRGQSILGFLGPLSNFQSQAKRISLLSYLSY